jgi:hypothetical protein
LALTCGECETHETSSVARPSARRIAGRMRRREPHHSRYRQGKAAGGEVVASDPAPAMKVASSRPSSSNPANACCSASSRARKSRPTARSSSSVAELRSSPHQSRGHASLANTALPSPAGLRPANRLNQNLADSEIPLRFQPSAGRSSRQTVARGSLGIDSAARNGAIDRCGHCEAARARL